MAVGPPNREPGLWIAFGLDLGISLRVDIEASASVVVITVFEARPR